MLTVGSRQDPGPDSEPALQRALAKGPYSAHSTAHTSYSQWYKEKTAVAIQTLADVGDPSWETAANLGREQNSRNSRVTRKSK